MKAFKSINLLALPLLLVTLSALAHDPSEHAAKNTKPDCAAMDTMDHASMDMNDPVMQAMMKKCMSDMPEGDAHHGHDSGQENAEPNNETNPQDQGSATSDEDASHGNH